MANPSTDGTTASQRQRAAPASSTRNPSHCGRSQNQSAKNPKPTANEVIAGVIGGAGALTAMVPAAIQLLTGATLYAKNLFRPILAPAMTDQQVAKLAKIMVLVLTLGALSFAIHSAATLVSLLLLGFAGVAQLFPGVVLGLYSRRVTTPGVFAGLAEGISVAAFLMLTGRDPYLGLNAGFIALCFNFAVTVVVSLLTQVRVAGFDQALSAVAASRS